MWHINNGDRILAGAEARLFADALWDFVQNLDPKEPDYENY